MKALIRIEYFLCCWTVYHSFAVSAALKIQGWMHKKWPDTKWNGK